MNTSNKKKILIIIYNIEGGGAEKVAVIISQLLSLNFYVYVRVGATSFKKFPELDGCNISSLFFKYNLNNLARLCEYFRRLIIVRREYSIIKPDFVLGFQRENAIRCGIALLFSKAKIIACEHSNYFWVRGRLHRFIRNVVYFLFIDKLVLLTKRDKFFYPFFLRYKISVIPNPISCNLTKKPSLQKTFLHKEVNILFVGRLIKEKGLDRLLGLCIFLNKQVGLNWRLTIAGDGELFGVFKNLIAECKLAEKVILLGNVDSVEDLYAKSDFLVFTSYLEGLPMVIGEAMSYGLPIVSYDCITGPAEFIDDGVSGYLVREGEDNDFHEKVMRLILNPEIRSSFSKEAIKKIANFHPDKILPLWLKILN